MNKGILNFYQAFDHRRRTLHGVLHVGSFEQFINQYQPFSAGIDLLNGVFDTLHFIKEKTLAFGNIVNYIDVGKQTVK